MFRVSWGEGMKERPILMTPENAQKCHDGTKTQTRRVVKLPLDRGTWGPFLFEGSKCTTAYGKPGDDMVCISNMKTGKTIACPYGQVGDRLWVREAWAWPGEEAFLYKGIPADARLASEWQKDLNCCQLKWMPSIHMPRMACRTVLEITEVRVERLQEISEEDALAEGVTRIDHGREYYFSAMRDEPDHRNWVDPTDAYKELWESINGKGSWGLNPWVWVISFRRVELCGR